MESQFRAPSDPGFRLIETFGWVPREGAVHAGLHLARMAGTARALGIAFDDGQARDLVQDVTGDCPQRCRLTLDVAGQFALENFAILPGKDLWRVAIAEDRLNSRDPWLRHKTTRRETYDEARANLPKGVDELVFLNEQGQLCEGTITNLFVELEDGECVTPPTSCGLLPGILRQRLLSEGQFAEKTVTPDDLRAARQVFVGNSLRGLIRAELV